jgi:hypothetical protein
MILTIEVTAEDIAKGARCCSSECPIALAVMRAYGQIGFASVACGSVVWFPGVPGKSGKKLWDVLLPVEAAWWYKDFDLGRRFDPITFELEVPNVSIPDSVADRVTVGNLR